MNGPAEVLITNARIDPDGSGGATSAQMAISGSRIAALGDDLRAQRGPDTRIVDLDGRYVMPGFADVHTHHLLAGEADLFELQISPAAALDEFLDRLAAHAAQLGTDEWVVGGNWGSGLLDAINTPEAHARLDEATGGRPTMLRDDSKHNRWVNSAALAAAGITDATPDPDGGQILRDQWGRATGVLIEAGGLAVETTRSAAGQASVERTARASERGIEILHSHGITAFQDAGASLQLLEGLKHLDDDGRLKAWVVTSMLANDFIFGVEPLGEGIIERREAYRSQHHRPDFIKIFLDGVPPTRSGAFLEPYLPDDLHGCDHRGHTTMNPAELEKWLLSTAERGISAKVHCTGDASVRLVLDAVEKVRERGFDRPRYHVAHGQFVHPDDIGRFAQLGVEADLSPALWFPGVIAEAIATVLPADRATRMQPNRDLLDAGALLAGGSDWPVAESPNPWEAIYGLVTRQDPTGRFPGTLWPEQGIGLSQAIAAYTTSCVRAMGLDDVTGRLTPGLSADFVVLDESPYDVHIDQLPRFGASQTWFAGETVYAK
ncbi:amidohydrolase [Zhihengliuella halotolerans]|uniref:amidohydrolase n=1 Tax=Zhihengliuella halotolerans TaxID=370736 RepID=UPI000C807E44|nr:amidohydrolase [Zhihengliuella halotolerans]